MILRLFAAAIHVVVAGALFAQDLAGFERVFIPFLGAQTHGIGGSQFRTVGISISEVAYSYWPHCGYGSYTPVIGRVEPAGENRIPLICRGGNLGRLLYVEKGAAERTSFGYVVESRVPDVDAIHQVSIPVARERDFKTSAFHIVVPYGSGRVTLRVYELSGRGDATVRVTVRAYFYTWRFGWGIRSDGEVMTLGHRERHDPSHPYFAEIPLDLDCIPTRPRSCDEWHAAIEIEPLSEGEYWAVVSRTHNTTQQVTLYWAQ